MTESDARLAGIIDLVADVLDVPVAQIGVDTTARDVEAWDSFGHVRIVLALEAALDIQLTMAEIERSDSIRGLAAAAETAVRRETS